MENLAAVEQRSAPPTLNPARGLAQLLGASAWVLRVNPFAEATVRIQRDRGQTVVISGPYRFVRHPMYIGAFLMYLGMPLVLGSVGALTLGAAIVALMIWRTSREDLALRQELPGYEEFTKRTRYRLLPGVW